jgi:hypothetical protein
MSTRGIRLKIFCLSSAFLLLAAARPQVSIAQAVTVGLRLDFPTGARPQSVAIGDINGDDSFDLVSVNNLAGTISVLLGDGTGGFGSKTDFPAGSHPYAVAIADINRDGNLDLAATNGGSNTVSVLLGLERTRTSLSATPNPVDLGLTLTLTATVSVPAPGTIAPTGSVRFFDGLTLLGTSPVSGGVAALTFPAPRLGYRSMTAAYVGDDTHFGSLAPSVQVLVVPYTPSGITPPVYPGGLGEGSTAFALEGAWPNPSSGGAPAVAFRLPDGSPALLELLDVSGRRVLEREVGTLGIGRHRVNLASERRLGPGIYLLRLTQGANS